MKKTKSLYTILFLLVNLLISVNAIAVGKKFGFKYKTDDIFSIFHGDLYIWGFSKNQMLLYKAYGYQWYGIFGDGLVMQDLETDKITKIPESTPNSIIEKNADLILEKYDISQEFNIKSFSDMEVTKHINVCLNQKNINGNSCKYEVVFWKKDKGKKKVGEFISKTDLIPQPLGYVESKNCNRIAVIIGIPVPSPSELGEYLIQYKIFGVHLETGFVKESINVYRKSLGFEFILPEGWIIKKEGCQGSRYKIVLQNTKMEFADMEGGFNREIIILREPKKDYSAITPYDQLLGKYVKLKENKDFKMGIEGNIYTYSISGVEKMSTECCLVEIPQGKSIIAIEERYEYSGYTKRPAKKFYIEDLVKSLKFY